VKQTEYVDECVAEKSTLAKGSCSNFAGDKSSTLVRGNNETK